MKTVIYNTETQQLVGPIRNGYLLVDGVRPVINLPMVELVIEEEKPSPAPVGFNNVSSWEIDLVNKVRRLVWTQVPKPEKPLQLYIADIESNFANRLKQGAEIGDIKIKIEDSDRAAFAQLALFLSELERVNQLPATVNIVDFDGVMHTLITNDVRNLIIQMGVLYQTLWNRKVELIALITNTPAADRPSVDISFNI